MRPFVGFLAVCVVLVALAPVSAEPPDTLWTRTFAGKESEVGFCVEATQDGGFIVAGYTDSYGAGDEDGYLIRLTADGDTLWTRVYGGPQPDRFQYVQPTSDGGFVAAGTTESDGHGYEDVWLLRTDADGSMLWSRCFGGMNLDQGWCVRETREGGFIVVGHTASFGGCDWDVYLIRTDSGGKEIWSRVFPGYSNYWDYGYGVLEAEDGGFVIVGMTAMNVTTGFDVLLIKVNKAGGTLWTKTYSWSAYDHEAGRSICATRDGGYMIAGNRYGDLSCWIQLLKVNADGDSLWSRAYAEADWADSYCVRETGDGGFVVAGHSGSWVNPDAYLLRTDAKGKPLWEGRIDDGGREYAYAVCPTPEGGCCAVGTTEPLGGQGPSDLWVLRLDHDWSRIDDVASGQSAALVLAPAVPSPVRDGATIFLQVPADQAGALNLYDLSGRWVRCLWQGSGSTGPEQIMLSRQGLASGVYFLRLQAGPHAVTRRLALSR